MGLYVHFDQFSIRNPTHFSRTFGTKTILTVVYVYALYYGPRRDKHPRWVPAIVRKAMGTRCFNVQVTPHGPVWRRHWEQLQPRHSSTEDSEPGEIINFTNFELSDYPMELPEIPQQDVQQDNIQVPEYGPHNPRRSKRTRKQTIRHCC